MLASQIEDRPSKSPTGRSANLGAKKCQHLSTAVSELGPVSSKE